MTELDHVWSQLLDGALAKADETGGEHVAQYLRLKATNDAIRKLGVTWLFDALIEIAGRSMHGLNPVTVEREEPHSFIRGNSNMVGSLLSLHQGVRCLTLEAGWARTPSDGIMQKGALAFARITHFGMPKKGSEIRLIHAETLPQWLDEADSAVDTAYLRQHFEVFIGS